MVYDHLVGWIQRGRASPLKGQQRCFGQDEHSLESSLYRCELTPIRPWVLCMYPAKGSPFCLRHLTGFVFHTEYPSSWVTLNS